MSNGDISDETILVSDFAPYGKVQYDKFQPDGEKLGPRKQPPLIIEKWARRAEQHTLMFASPHGKGRSKGRANCIMELGRIRDDRLYLFTLDFLQMILGK